MALKIMDCTGNVIDCPVIKMMLGEQDFAQIVERADPSFEDHRELMGELILSCSKGACPGKNKQATIEALKSIIRLGIPNID